MFYYELKSKIILFASGKDSRRYLNSRLTNDIKSLKSNNSLVAGLLTPQGKTQAVFDVIALTDNEFILLCDGGDKKNILDSTTQYIVADKVIIQDKSDQYSILHIFSSIHNLEIDPNLQSSSDSKVAKVDEVYLNIKIRTEYSGFDLIAPSDSITEYLNRLFPTAKSISEEDWRTYSFRSGIPTFPREIREGSLLATAGLKSVIAMNKGCYVGQEVIEKVDSHGKLPLSVVRLEKPGYASIREDSPVRTNEDSNTEQLKAVGRVLSSCYDKERDISYAYAEIRQSVINSPLYEINGENSWFKSS